MKNIIGFRTIKTGLGAAISMILAESIGLNYSLSAGVITILSIQNTKKASLQIALRRVIAAILALLIGSVLFITLGFNPIIFGVYLIVFIPIAVKLNVTEGIVPASVLITHLLGERSVTIDLFLNEMALMVVGVCIALLLNLYMPSVEREILQDKKKIEDAMYTILNNMSMHLSTQTDYEEELDVLQDLECALKSGRRHANLNSDNNFTDTISLHVKYFEMRQGQYQVMLYMLEHFKKISKKVIQTEPVCILIDQLALSIKGRVKIEELEEHLVTLREIFKESKLPVTREEFENRAMLYQFLNNIELLIDIKKQFKQSLSEAEKIEYDKYYDM